ncbi:uncharacterized protein AMSG_07986 [Thecamonas trahens ATCC 50062]|uniref:SIN1-type PH domain-containing protein n=1 Tax=Thecamonas trahens ATCC 50062 TaxID=461836 RepID=A0A0L0DHU8_THETB|nr:hypothetical protein AMSG_07986 [Thecamonas trahens ATCC 50062]KNC51887.1 hypothetical protein AMSG_07986 [Thecamonas trahens ATCC 50062]|eukprot:XP_013755744.1 hypothetical protein AMSG_07986 [Thecamonas trahens ATCC 50062]
MNVDLFVGHVLYAINHSAKCGDSVSRNLHSGSPTSATNTLAYGHTLPADQSYFEPVLEPASVSRTEKIKAANKRRKNPKRTTTIVSFTSSSSPASGSPDTHSGLSDAPLTKKALPPRSQRTKALPMQSALARSVDGDLIEVRVWVVVGGARKPSTPPLVFKLPSMSTMAKLAARAVELYSRAGHAPALVHTSPLGYVMRLAEDETGLPELDFPALDRAQLLSVMGTTEFVLCDNPNAEADIAAESSKRLEDARTTRLGAGRTTKRRVTAGRRALTVHSVHGSDPAAPDMDTAAFAGKNVRIRIHFPNGAASVLMFDAAISIQQLLKIASNKRTTHLEDCTVHRTEDGPEVDKRTPLGMIPKLSELFLKSGGLARRRGTIGSRSGSVAASTNDNTLAPPSSDGQRSRSSTLTSPSPLQFQFSEFTAIMYKEYALVKINKAGRRQQRVLGIDGDRLHNKTIQQAAGKKSSKFGKLFKSGEVKRPYREWSEVLQIERLNELEFVISFIDKSSNHYEAETVAQADEILAKLTVLFERRV